MPTPYEIDVHAVKLRILRLADERNVQSDVLVTAMADIIGLAAAHLEAKDDRDLDSRLDVLIARIRAAYLNARGKVPVLLKG